MMCIMTDVAAAIDRAPRYCDYNRDSETMARHLLGQRLVRVDDTGARLSGRIVEVEAYLGLPDKAAHTYNGRRTLRNESMYLPGGHAYVYLIYGMHECLNIVCGEADDGIAVLIRALQPEEGVDSMWQRRAAARSETDLCSGPAKLTQALDIDRRLDGENLIDSPVLYIEQPQRHPLPLQRIERGPRVGVSYAEEWADKPLRFWIAGNPHVSRGR